MAEPLAEDGDQVAPAEPITRREILTSSAFAITVGVLIALVLLATIYVYPMGDVVVSTAVTVAFGVLLVAALLLYRWGRRGATPQWRQAYARGFVLTIVIYVVGIAVSNWTQLTTPALWIPWAIATAAPLVVVGVRAKRE